jgi:rhomboid protease GluP
MIELAEIHRSTSYAEADQLALVLAAVGIACHLAAGGGAVRLLVTPSEADRARQELDAYWRENRPRGRAWLPFRPARHGLDAALAYVAVLLFFFVADRRHVWTSDWVEQGAAQAGLIGDGAWWRAFTSLTLHADLGHLLGNLGAGIVVGLLLAQCLGSGLAWLAILLAGALGNGVNALLHSPEHTAVGASTAVFGGLGLLAGYLRRRQTVPWRGGIRRWAPLSAGILLLVYMGFGGERTDVGAHVSGFAVGSLLGLALGHYPVALPQGPGAQWLYGASALMLLALAWLLALMPPG